MQKWREEMEGDERKHTIHFKLAWAENGCGDGFESTVGHLTHPNH